MACPQSMSYCLLLVTILKVVLCGLSSVVVLSSPSHNPQGGVVWPVLSRCRIAFSYCLLLLTILTILKVVLCGLSSVDVVLPSPSHNPQGGVVWPVLSRCRIVFSSSQSSRWCCVACPQSLSYCLLLVTILKVVLCGLSSVDVVLPSPSHNPQGGVVWPVLSRCRIAFS